MTNLTAGLEMGIGQWRKINDNDINKENWAMFSDKMLLSC